MNRFLPWLLALCALALVANFAWTGQETPKPKPAKHPAQTQAQKNRAARHAALKAVLPTMKTRLSEAIQLAEKETGGVAYSAGVEITKGKGSFQVNLFINDRFSVASVDPETKKVTLVTKKEGEEEGEGNTGGEASSEGDGGEGEGGEMKDE